MRILVMNPNSTVSMTDKIVESARQAASEGTEIIAATGGAPAPASIQGHHDEAMSVPGLIARLKQAEADGVDGVVVACFDDPGIRACREVFSGPVLGICEAATKAASSSARRTTSDESKRPSGWRAKWRSLPPSDTAPRTASIGAPGAAAWAKGTSSSSSPPVPCRRRSGDRLPSDAYQRWAKLSRLTGLPPT